MILLYTRALIATVALALLVPCVSARVDAAPLAPADLAGYLARCAPHVHPQTQAALIDDESSGDPLAIHDDNTGREYAPATEEEAEALAESLIARDRAIDGRGVDVGIGQINSHNFAAQGLTLARALDPCENLRVSARMLRNAYLAHGSLRAATEVYNSGSPTGDDGYFARLRVKARSRYVTAVVTEARRVGADGSTLPHRPSESTRSALFYSGGP